MRALLMVLALLAAPAFAQDARAPYSEVEALRVENLALERQVVARALLDWQTKAKQLKADLEKTRPGWVFNPDDGTWAAAKPPTGE